MNRRDMLKTGALAGGAVVLGSAKSNATESQWETSYAGVAQQPALEPGLPNKDYTPVVTPNNSSLPWKVVDGVKVFHLVAEEVWHAFACWFESEVLGLQWKGSRSPRLRRWRASGFASTLLTNSKLLRLFTGTAFFCLTGWTALEVSPSALSHRARPSNMSGPCASREPICTTPTMTK